MNILEKIAATKRREVEAMKRVVSESAIKNMAHNTLRTPLSLCRSILDRNPGIIAEHKRRSPSRGDIHQMSEVGVVARGYAENGAAAMSVLTDTPYFGGSLADLAVARMEAATLPLLRKEFIVDEYQIYQSRLWGADAILLIAAMLDARKLARFNDIAHSLGLETLVEIHNEREIEALPEDADMVGVNNRDLKSFATDISHSDALISRLPYNMVKIAESGLRSPQDIVRLREAGFDGFLIGEAFMSAPDPAAMLGRFIKESR